MEFDSESGRPTYRLVRGAPGGSEALALAERLGLPEAWLSRAEELLSPEERQLRSLLQTVEASKQALDSDRERLQDLISVAERDRLEASELLAEASREKTLAAKRLKREFREFRASRRGGRPRCVFFQRHRRPGRVVSWNRGGRRGRRCGRRHRDAPGRTVPQPR